MGFTLRSFLDGLPQRHNLPPQSGCLCVHSGFVERGGLRRAVPQVVKDQHLVNIGLVLARPAFGPCF